MDVISIASIIISALAICVAIRANIIAREASKKQNDLTERLVKIEESRRAEEEGASRVAILQPDFRSIPNKIEFTIVNRSKATATNVLLEKLDYLNEYGLLVYDYLSHMQNIPSEFHQGQVFFTQLSTIAETRGVHIRLTWTNPDGEKDSYDKEFKL
jgi:hypothetical protein